MKKLGIFLAAIFIYSFLVEAQEMPEKYSQEFLQQQRSEFEKIIQEYKEYLGKVPVEIREEIIGYRRKISALNQEKILLYEKLSQKAQEYLQKEQLLKKKLPLTENNKVDLSKLQLNKTEKSEKTSKK